MLRRNALIITALLILFAVGPWHSAMAQQGLARVGPVEPIPNVGPGPDFVTGFPRWYQDFNDIALELCVDESDGANGMCIFDPIDPSNPVSVQSGFGDEAFWWVGDAILAPDFPLLAGVDGHADPASAIPAGDLLVDGSIVQSLEAAYFTGPPALNDQFPFARIRIRIDLLPGAPSGIYTIKYPFGQREFDVEPGVRVINFTSDIGSTEPNFGAALKGEIGPFLRWTTHPADPDLMDAFGFRYLGNPLFEHAATDGTRDATTGELVRSRLVIEAPGPICNLAYAACEDRTGNGLVGNTVFTELWAIMGREFRGTTPVPLQVTRSTYRRPNGGNNDAVEVFARSVPGAILTVTGAGLTPIDMTAGTAVGDQQDYFAQLTLAEGAPQPMNVTVTAHKLDKPSTPKSSLLLDLVDIASAEYDVSTGVITVRASSSDPSLNVSLSILGPTGIRIGELSSPVFTTPPPSVSVSTLHPGHLGMGGIATKEIRLVNVAPPSSLTAVDDPGPYLVNEAPEVLVINDLLANDTLPAAGQRTINIISGSAGSVITGSSCDPALAQVCTVSYTAPPNFSGLDNFGYSVTVGTETSNAATVTVSVNARPSALADGTSLAPGDPAATICVLDNDIDSDGSIVGLALTSQPTLGSAVLVSDPSCVTPLTPFNAVSYTPPASGTGVVEFQYQITDDRGALSLPGIVTVNVTASETFLFQQAQYDSRKARWRIRGTTSIGNANSVTLNLIRGIQDLGVIAADVIVASVPASPDGDWEFRGDSSNPDLPAAQQGDEIRVTSRYGGTATAPLTFK